MASRLVRVNPVTVNDVLDGHVDLDLECLDRLYLNGYLAQLQVGGQVVQFLRHRGFPVPSPACLQQIGDAFRRSVACYAEANHIPVVVLKSTDRNIDVMRRYLDSAARQGRSQVAAIGVAQEPQRVFIARRRDTDPAKPPQFSFDKKDRRVTAYYFYLWDGDFGPAFIKVCTYCPWPIKVWVNGHEWSKRQASRAGLRFTELSNGFADTEDPAALQQICDRLGPGAINVFFQRWLARLPLPLTAADRRAGYWWELSMAQTEVSRTLVFDAPRRARGFFEALVADHLDVGRPDTIEILFDRQIRGGKRATAGQFRTNVITRGTEVTVNAFYKHSRIKQYLKDGRALRIETVINAPNDLGCQRRLHNLDDLQAKARAVNARLLQTERVGQSCVLANPVFERIAHPTVTAEGAESYSHAVRRLSGPSPGRRPVRHPVRRHRHHQQEPARPDDRTARRPLRHHPGQLRPGPTAPQRADHPTTPHQHLPPHRRRAAVRHLLHQGPQPRPDPALCRRPTPSTTRPPHRITHHRPAHRPTTRPRPPTSDSLTLSSNVEVLATKGR